MNEQLNRWMNKWMNTISLLQWQRSKSKRTVTWSGVPEWVSLNSKQFHVQKNLGMLFWIWLPVKCLSLLYACSNWEFGDIYWVSNLWIISDEIQRAGSLWLWRSLESPVAYYNIFAHFENSGKNKFSKLQPQASWHTRLLRMSNLKNMNCGVLSNKNSPESGKEFSNPLSLESLAKIFHFFILCHKH